jgi:hypothetical protein
MENRRTSLVSDMGAIGIIQAGVPIICALKVKTKSLVGEFRNTGNIRWQMWDVCSVSVYLPEGKGQEGGFKGTPGG